VWNITFTVCASIELLKATRQVAGSEQHYRNALRKEEISISSSNL